MADEVSSGLFKWFTEEELDVVKGYYKSAVKGHSQALSKNGRLVIRGSGDGQSYEMPEGVHSLEQLRQELELAYAQINEVDPPVSDRAVVRFR